MSIDQGWITERITESRKHHPTVTESVFARMENLLNSQLGAGHLTKNELAKVANELIEGMVPARLDVDVSQ